MASHALRLLIPFLLALFPAPRSVGQQRDELRGPVLPGLQAVTDESRSAEGELLDPDSAGRILLGELQCNACHAGLPDAFVPGGPGPDLSEVGWRVAPGYLERFIRNPGGTQIGTRMPALLEGLDEARARQIATNLTHYLVDRAGRPHASQVVDPREIVQGEELYHSIGCVACHAPRRADAQGGAPPRGLGGLLDLGHLPAKYSLDSLTGFLFEPRRNRPAGRMPDMGLSRAEARALASYLIGPDAPVHEEWTVDPQRARAGARAFREFRCDACHPLDGLPAPRPVIKGRLDLRGGCLSSDDPQTPRYHLEERQRSALTRTLSRRTKKFTDDTRITGFLTTFHCVACHTRDDLGGVNPALDPYFTTDQPGLGDPARIPPDLTLVGARLRGEWLRRVLFDGAAVRPYMHTRMPRFDSADLGHLPDLLAEVDVVEPFEMFLYEGDEATVARDAGRQLVGSNGAACITCHDFNGMASPGMSGLDLVDTCDRLQPGWFKAFLCAPQELRPGIIMPQYWPGGEAVQKTILGGDTEAQIRALWFYLAAGRTARTPDGIESRPTRLEVTDRARTYRGRSSIAGFRGIAVGFPDGVNYAFDANNGTLAGLWRGDFLTVRWDGQGAGGFRPAGPAVELARDLSLFRLADESDPWPLAPVTSKEQPVNPDPRYPRNHGYRFRGYVLDGDQVPTFRYEIGGIAIEDRSVGRLEGDRAVLRRVLRVTSETAETLWFRALAGDVKALADGRHRLGRLLLTVEDARVLLRPSAGPGAEPMTEMLIELGLPAGESEWRLEYEIRS